MFFLCFCLKNTLKLRMHSCQHVPSMVYFKYEDIIGLHACICLCLAANQCERLCVCLCERQWKERGSLTLRKSLNNSPCLYPAKWFMNISVG